MGGRGEDLGVVSCDGMICSDAVRFDGVQPLERRAGSRAGARRDGITFIAPHSLHARPLVVAARGGVDAAERDRRRRRRSLVDGQRVGTAPGRRACRSASASSGASSRRCRRRRSSGATARRSPHSGADHRARVVDAARPAGPAVRSARSRANGGRSCSTRGHLPRIRASSSTDSRPPVSPAGRGRLHALPLGSRTRRRRSGRARHCASSDRGRAGRSRGAYGATRVSNAESPPAFPHRITRRT